jgi:UDP-3-O-acyl-N-acetylglucosamine deacetylase
MLHAVEQLTNQGGAPATAMQQTLAGPVTVTGKGLLLGEDATVTIEPAPPNHGIIFERVDSEPAGADSCHRHQCRAARPPHDA